MSAMSVDSFNECANCGKEFQDIKIPDPRKGYDVLAEYTEKWKIRCKGCDTALVVAK